MPRHEFFSGLGLFSIIPFLAPSLCAEISSEMRSATGEPGVVLTESGHQVMEDLRRVQCAAPPVRFQRLLRDRLEAIRPQLEKHFGVPLEPKPSAEFLVYREGGHYKFHRDSARDPNWPHHRRRVSIVVFLNRESGAPSDGYGGGKLVLHGIMKEPQWANCAFALDPHPGLLLAFPSDLPHEVTPVTSGCRCTIVSWFLEPSGELGVTE
jgi:predicted 2-oxoglutarate/Fe(II)-dependent dioxygenase YbiX